ncbi:Hsp70 family protein [Prosthecochloris sp. SCSIO W1101]|uniref:Hsp70 family protein n=1 Tax=Prosthecochloris sp. SCSIO W1101 TaxID=2992242 RepID=UPI00223D165A|nr:Hsp70 family protein [Prosthecochloris sp. SCSIO W1101]UZJ40277.1 Hsp70 family protein [Prosthecochloris sp. SCSIO W1101]
MHIIGIDFGTSYTTAAWLNPKTGLPELIRFLDSGQEKLPSLVYYGIEETLVGEAALHMLQEVNNYPEDERMEIQASIVCSLKRRMDTKGIHVLPHQTEPVSHVEIIKDIFAKIRDEAERAVFGGEAVKGCVITHPVVFSEIKKNMLRDGASKAGFEQVELIEEPIAAAKGYVASGAKVGSGILVYDFGGGTFDVAYVSKDEKGIYRTPVAPDGDDRCGGDDLDIELYRYWERIVQETHKRRISSGNGVVDLTFLMRCRRHKESLTRQTKAAFRETLPPPGNIRMKLELDRATLNQLIRPYIDRTVQKTKSLLKRVKEKGYEVDTVVLVGGSSKIPLVREQLQKILPVEPLETMHVDVAVAMGAAVHRQEEPDNNHKNNLKKEKKSMNAEIYEAKRNELIEILGDVSQIQKLPEKTKKEIEKVKQKSLENSFEIALVGEFQGGKSTTFNAICDGREISPRGAMVKTSACKISARNLADDTIEEYAQIIWKSDRELLLGMIGLIAPHLRNIEPKRFGEAGIEQMLGEVDNMGLVFNPDQRSSVDKTVKPLDIRNKADQKLIQKALAEEWKIYKKNKNSYGHEKLDVLYISSLVAHFVDNKVINEISNNEQMQVYEMGKLVTFPLDWAARWEAGSPKAFRAEEVVFAFVAGARCYIHSPNLARLGCVITDCPGLFASPWDTEVARKAMLEADAILYLFGGDKALGQGDILALSEIRNLKMDHKLFYAINMKWRIHNIEKTILPENLAKLRAQGFNVLNSDIQLYHALLGLCSRNGLPILSNSLDKYSTNRFVEIAKTVSGDYPVNYGVKEIWVDIADDMIRNIVRNDHINELKNENVEKIADYSRFDSLFNRIEKAVVEKKAYAILVSQGAQSASTALSLLEGNLRSSEEIAKRGEEEFKNAAAEARKKMNLFQSKAKIILKRIYDKVSIDALAGDFEDNVIKQSVDQMANSITDAICDNYGNLLKISFDKKKLEKTIKPILQESISSSCEPAIQGWIENIKNGDSACFNQGIKKRVEDVAKDIREEWNNITLDVKDSFSLLKGLEIESPTGTISTDERLFKDFNNEDIQKAIGVSGGFMVVGKVVSALVGTVVGIVSLIIVLQIVGTPFGGLIPIVSGIIGGGFAGVKIMGFAKKKVAEVLRKKVKANLLTTFTTKEASDRLRIESEKVVKAIVGLFHVYFEKKLDEQQKLFNARVEKADADYKKTEEERRNLARELHKLRVEQIAPVKSRIDAFLESVMTHMHFKEVAAI